MKQYPIVLFLMLFVGVFSAVAQISPDCTTAVSICDNTPLNFGTSGFGIDDFNGASRTGCLETTASGAIESNAAWYRFRTGAAGQLGFNIGFNDSEDWDFALYKASDCSDLGEPLRCNFFDNSQQRSFMGVGQDPTGIQNSLQYEDWLDVLPGEEYFLLINNFSATNSGFSIQFSGQLFETNPFDALDCTIVTNLLGPPIAACEGDAIVLNATVTNAGAYTWFRDLEDGNGFHEILGESDANLAPTIAGTYRVEVRTNLGDVLQSDVQVAFADSASSFPVADVTLCVSSNTYDLSQKDAEVLGLQNPNDYMVSYHRTLTDAVDGSNSLPKNHSVAVGIQTIFVRVSPLANQRCFDVAQDFEINGVEVPFLNFPDQVFLCVDTSSIRIGEENSNSNFQYSWDSGQATSSIVVSEAGAYTLTATNEGCTNSRTVEVISLETPKITEIKVDGIQSSNTITIETNRDDLNYQLDDGPVQNSNTFQSVDAGMHNVTLIDTRGCGSVTEAIVVVGPPNFFTPNGDGINDSWHIIGISTLENPHVFVYDRVGRLIVHLIENSIGWDGTFEGEEMPATDYWFKLTYMDRNGQNMTARFLQNHFALRR